MQFNGRSDHLTSHRVIIFLGDNSSPVIDRVVFDMKWMFCAMILTLTLRLAFIKGVKPGLSTHQAGYIVVKVVNDVS